MKKRTNEASDSFGLVIFESGSEEALMFMNGYPAVAEGIINVKLFPIVLH